MRGLASPAPVTCLPLSLGTVTGMGCSLYLATEPSLLAAPLQVTQLLTRGPGRTLSCRFKAQGAREHRPRVTLYNL